jgi:uroporphyrinogen decarboxylase
MSASFDPKAFWVENADCLGKPFRTEKPRAPLTLGFDEHWLFEEMAVPSTLRYYNDPSYQAEANRACNDRCEQAIGLRPYSEQPSKPGMKRIELLFGSRIELHEGGTPWLEPGHTEPGSLTRKLDELEAMSEDELMEAADGHTVEPTGGDYVAWSRGPTTVATSVLGPERMLEWLFDEPELMRRYFNVFAQVIIRYHLGIARRKGARVTGCAWLDDFCCLMSPSLYEQFALLAMHAAMDGLERHSAGKYWRFQHSDSDMGHLLPFLAQLRLDGVNFGPKVTVRMIRDAMPRTEIHGQIPPFMLRNRPMGEVEAQVRADFEEVGRDGSLVVTTAGSIAAGTTLERIRGLMEIVERECRFRL